MFVDVSAFALPIESLRTSEERLRWIVAAHRSERQAAGRRGRLRPIVGCARPHAGTLVPQDDVYGVM
ncbi:MAG: hypothetical protein NZ750_02305 [Anaerolineae bacterium]|nr:hypothetical protein [Anaerolineae bacterium]MDW8173488.1 hypothetical protein [Anaerolineae bacterium]